MLPCLASPTTATALPLLLPYNPVWRSYHGGHLLRQFRRVPSIGDNHFPEDWIASGVLARNDSQSQSPREGISFVPHNGRSIEFPELLKSSPSFRSQAAGHNNHLGVLLKLLDAADRLHFQAHPGDTFVQQNLSGTHGKTECWYILNTRQNASVYLGFQNPPSRSKWKEMIVNQDIEGMKSCFDPVPVKPGDCYVVPAGVPHAIGSGIFMMELQQPSDWVVRAEFTVGGHTLPESARYMGLDLDRCLDLFDYSRHSVSAFKQKPRILHRQLGSVEEEMIAPEWHRFFRLHRHHGSGPMEWQSPLPAVMVMLEGQGRLSLPEPGGRDELRQRGDVTLLPASETPFTWNPLSPRWEMLMALPPSANESEPSIQEIP
jgi:mannose-6-phosphate isomerase